MRVPVIVQMHSGENGATALAMILSYYKKYLPMETIRSKCLYTRNGSTPGQLLEAARYFGMDGEVKKIEQAVWKKLTFPCIAQWKRKYFVVVTGFKKGRVKINDPSKGAVSLREEDFFRSCTGWIIELRKGKDFVPEGKPDSVSMRIRKRMEDVHKSAVLIAGAHAVSTLMKMAMLALVQVMMDRGVEGKADGVYMSILALMTVSLATSLLFSVYENLKIYRVSRGMAARSGSRLFKKMLRLPMQFFEQHFAGELMDRLDQNMQIDRSLLINLLPRFCDFVTTLFYLVLMVYYQPVLAIICLSVEVLYIMISLYMQRMLADAYRSMNSNSSAMNTSLLNGLNTIETIKSMGAERSFFAGWIRTQNEYRNSQTKTQMINMFMSFIGEVHGMLVSAVLLFGGVVFIINGNFTMGMMTAFQAILVNIRSSLGTLISTGQTIQMMRSNIERVDDIFERDSEEKIESEVYPDKLQGAIEIRNLCYRYNSGDAMAVDDVSFKVEPGQLVAIVGSTGCGKSTLLKILADLYRPVSGEILYDGHRRQDISDVVFRSSVGCVDQELTFFEDSIKANLKMWDKTIEDYEMILAARDAQIHNRIMQNSENYDAPVLENGRNYSGGELQRMELARALSQEPTLLLLDEFTSALDAVTEEKVFQAIKNKGTTCILAAHRLSTVRQCDQILVMKDGKIIERGNHEELYRSGTLYQQLIDMQ